MQRYTTNTLEGIELGLFGHLWPTLAHKRGISGGFRGTYHMKH